MNLIHMSIIASIMIMLGMLIRHFTLAKIPKKTFVFIWMLVMIRLLIPFEMPFGINFPRNVSVVNSDPVLESRNIQFIIPSVGAQNSPIEHGFTIATNPNAAEHISDVDASLDPTNAIVWIWALGMVTIATYFVISHIKFSRYISDSIPIQNKFTQQLMNGYQLKLKRKIQIRQSQKIVSPLTYGVMNPVILVPKMFNWHDSNQLEYIFAHEYIHIKRFDCLIKTVATIVLCIHWFNPLVWVMYVLLHRDIELSCDEKILELFGEQAKSNYALTLIDLAEKQNNLITAYSHFSKHVGIEERIKMIAKMNIKKESMIGAALAVMLVGGTMVAFATGNDADMEDYSESYRTDLEGDIEEYEIPVYELTDLEDTELVYEPEPVYEATEADTDIDTEKYCPPSEKCLEEGEMPEDYAPFIATEPTVANEFGLREVTVGNMTVRAGDLFSRYNYSPDSHPSALPDGSLSFDEAVTLSIEAIYNQYGFNADGLIFDVFPSWNPTLEEFDGSESASTWFGMLLAADYDPQVQTSDFGYGPSNQQILFSITICARTGEILLSINNLTGDQIHG